MLDPVDKLFLGYFSGLALLMAIRAVDWQVALAAIVAAVVVAQMAWLTRRRRLATVHAFAPIAYVLVGFELSAAAGVVNPLRGDGWLEMGQQRWFPAVAASWFGALGRPSWLTDLAYLAYVGFYFVPLIIAVETWRRDRLAFSRFVRLICLGFVVLWIGYLVLPTSGPRVRFDDAELRLGGGLISRGARAFLATFERNRWDAFPSGHTAVSILYVAGAWRALRRWRAPLLLWAVGAIFSTVYLSVHYVPDVIAGVAVAAGVLAFDLLVVERRLAVEASSVEAGTRLAS